MNIVWGFVCILVLYILNRIFNYKSNLIKLFPSVFLYKLSIFIIYIIFGYVYIFNLDKSIYDTALGTSVFFSYFYLIFIPSSLR